MRKTNIDCCDDYKNFVVLNKNFCFALRCNINIIRIFHELLSRRKEIYKNHIMSIKRNRILTFYCLLF